MSKSLSENQVEDAVKTWLERAGWTVRRQHVGTFYTRNGTPISMGKKGMCDWWASRAVRGYRMVEFLEYEAKASKKKPSDEQREYMAKRKHFGYVCIWSNSLEMFQEKYTEVFGANA